MRTSWVFAETVTNKDNPIVVEDMEAAVKTILTFMGNASSQCNVERKTLILEEYYKDFVAFGQDSDLFSSATTTLFGPSFPEKVVEHLTQLKTLCQTQSAGSKVSQEFFKAFSQYTQQGGRTKTILRQQNSLPYSR